MTSKLDDGFDLIFSHVLTVRLIFHVFEGILENGTS